MQTGNGKETVCSGLQHSVRLNIINLQITSSCYISDIIQTTELRNAHLRGQSVEDLSMMFLTDAHRDHVPQVPQHCHKRKRLSICNHKKHT